MLYFSAVWCRNAEFVKTEINRKRVPKNIHMISKIVTTIQNYSFWLDMNSPLIFSTCRGNFTAEF